MEAEVPRVDTIFVGTGRVLLSQNGRSRSPFTAPADSGPKHVPGEGTFRDFWGYLSYFTTQQALAPSSAYHLELGSQLISWDGALCLSSSPRIRGSTSFWLRHHVTPAPDSGSFLASLVASPASESYSLCLTASTPLLPMPLVTFLPTCHSPASCLLLALHDPGHVTSEMSLLSPPSPGFILCPLHLLLFPSSVILPAPTPPLILSLMGASDDMNHKWKAHT